MPDVVPMASGRVLIQTQGSLHFVHCPLSTPPKHLQKWDSQRLLLGVRWPQQGCDKMLTQPLSPLDFCLSLQSGPSLLPAQPLTRQMWQSPCPFSLRGVLVPSTCPDPLGPVCCNPPSSPSPLRVGRKSDGFQILFLQVHIINMAFPTPRSGSYFQA